MYYGGNSCCQGGSFPYQSSYPFYGGCGCSNNNSSYYAIILVLFILLVIVIGSRFTR